MRRWMISIALLGACTQLPAEWRSADEAEGFTQSACTANVSQLEPRGGEQLAVQPADGGRLRVEYHNAHFRCEQRVTGYVRVSGSSVDVLVQPADMNPSSVAKCDCLYDVRLEVPRLGPGTYDVTLHRRWDNWPKAKEPVRIGSRRVTVR